MSKAGWTNQLQGASVLVRRHIEGGKPQEEQKEGGEGIGGGGKVQNSPEDDAAHKGGVDDEVPNPLEGETGVVVGIAVGGGEAVAVGLGEGGNGGVEEEEMDENVEEDAWDFGGVNGAEVDDGEEAGEEGLAGVR